MSREAMTMALDALENHTAIKHPQQRHYRDAAIDALRAALDAPEPDYERGFIDGMQEQMKRSVDRAVRSMAALDAYDQTALELCETCGWKAIVPGDGCLVCARQQIKPVAYADSRIHGWPECFVMEPDPPHTVPLYAAPREWVGLPDMEVYDLADKYLYGGKNYGILSFYKAIEAKLKEKNV